MRLIDLSYPGVTAQRYGISRRTAMRLKKAHPNGMPEEGLKVLVEASRRLSAVRKREKKRVDELPTYGDLGFGVQVPGKFRKK